MEEARKLLTPEELSQVDAFADKIDLSDSAAIMNYGASTQKKLADLTLTMKKRKVCSGSLRRRTTALRL